LNAQKFLALEFAGIVLDGVTLEEKVRYDNLIQPYDDTLKYDPGVLNMHGITLEECVEKGIPLKQLVKDMCELFLEGKNGSKYQKPILVGHNAGYDVPFLEDLFERCNVDLSKYVEGWYDRHGVFH